MHITNSDVPLVSPYQQQRPDAVATPASSRDAFAALTQLDADHDGWIDADDIPYEPPPVWERPAEDGPAPQLPKAEVGAKYSAAAEAPVPMPDGTVVAEVRSRDAPAPARGSAAAAAAQIDLLA